MTDASMFEAKKRQLLHVAETDYERDSDRAREVLAIIDGAPTVDEQVALLEVVLTQINARYHTSEKLESDDVIADEVWRDCCEKVAGQIDSWKRRFDAGLQPPREVASYLLEKLRKYTDNDRMVALALLLKRLTPYRQIADDLYDVDVDERESMRNNDEVVDARGIIKMVGREIADPDEMALVAAKVLRKLEPMQAIHVLRELLDWAAISGMRGSRNGVIGGFGLDLGQVLRKLFGHTDPDE